MTPLLVEYRGKVLARSGRFLAASVATVLAPALLLMELPPSHEADLGLSTTTVPDQPLKAVVGDPHSWTAAANAAAATCPGLPASVLMAIGHVETRLGHGHTSPAGAIGPMQFLPGTWSAYGTDGDGDGMADVLNPVDALFGAARLLCANGGGERSQLRSAVWNYNHSTDYVDEILDLAGVAG